MLTGDITSSTVIVVKGKFYCSPLYKEKLMKKTLNI